jgi:pimeloyl-ACP methyl ester carboxylesterase
MSMIARYYYPKHFGSLLIFVIYVFLASAAMFGAGLAYQAAGSRSDRRRYPAPGQVLKVNGRSMHIHREGAGIPVVVLEAGIAASSVSWAPVQRAVARSTRVISYDRAGLGWSEPAAHPLSMASLIEDLRAVLKASGEPPPYIFVGHSFGGLLVRLYAAAYPSDAAGLVLVDPALVSEWASPTAVRRSMLERGVRFSRRGGLLARIGIVRLGLTLAAKGAHRAAKFITRASSSPGGQKTVERLVGEIRKMPPELWPVVRAHWSMAKSFDSMARHLALLPEVCRAASQCAAPLDIPLIVISGGHLTPEQRAEQEALAASSSRGRHILAQDSGHWVHLDQPELVAEAVSDVIRMTHR